MSLSGDLCQQTSTANRRARRPDARSTGRRRSATSTWSPEPRTCRRACGSGPANASARSSTSGSRSPPIGLDSHMVFAFSPADTPIPHFTLDSVFGQGTYAFHLDLIQRVDLGTHLAYLDRVYSRSTAVYERAIALEGLSKASDRSAPVLDDVAVDARATAPTRTPSERSTSPCGTYQEHWFSLLSKGIATEVTESHSDTDLR